MLSNVIAARKESFQEPPKTVAQIVAIAKSIINQNPEAYSKIGHADLKILRENFGKNIKSIEDLVDQVNLITTTE